MEITREQHISGNGWFWAFRNKNGTQFSCEPGKLEELLIDCIEKSTEDFIIHE